MFSPVIDSSGELGEEQKENSLCWGFVVRYAELQTTTNFSFLRGGSNAEEIVEEATRLGHCAIGVVDRLLP